LDTSRDITRITLLVLVIGALLVGSVWTLQPFLSGLIWATAIAITTWPLLLRLQQLTGRRSVAAAVLTLVALLTFIVPCALAINTLLGAASQGPAVLNDFFANGLPPPPEWIAQIPVVGGTVAERWRTISAGGPEALETFVQPYASAVATWAIAVAGNSGRTLVLVLVTLALVPILYVQGETAARGALAFGRRLGGDTGDRTIRVAGQAVRSVALGVVVTAIVQSMLVGLGLWFCGVPHPGFLTALAFAFGIAQLGPLPVLAIGTTWLYWTGSTTLGTVLAIWSVPVLALDNVLRPVLIRRGVKLPLLLIIGGVIGGLVGFGVVGLFVGPVVLATTYTLAKDWVAGGHADRTNSVQRVA
jgi:predicted PurR-regulated permease PerM